MGLAVIAAEDQKFPEHWGSTCRRLRKRWRTMNVTRPASARVNAVAADGENLFLWDGRSWLRKGLEAGLTVGIETVWSKSGS